MIYKTPKIVVIPASSIKENIKIVKTYGSGIINSGTNIIIIK